MWSSASSLYEGFEELCESSRIVALVDAVVFCRGVDVSNVYGGRPVEGVLSVCPPLWVGESREFFVGDIWPTIANSRAWWS